MHDPQIQTPPPAPQRLARRVLLPTSVGAGLPVPPRTPFDTAFALCAGCGASGNFQTLN